MKSKDIYLMYPDCKNTQNLSKATNKINTVALKERWLHKAA